MSKSEFHIPHSTFNIEFFAPQKTLGGYCGGVPPLPIPNREVKPACADGTAMQCGRVGGCLLLLGSSRSNDFGDLFFCSVLLLVYIILLILLSNQNDKTMDKQSRYRELLSQIEVFANADDNPISVLSNCAAVMKVAFPKEFFWVGFYIVDGDELILGPFQGTPACTRIKFGRGVCGTAWKEARSLVVEDVEAFPGHIACSSLSRSEIVVPLFSDGVVVGEIDIDSTELSTFDDIDREYLEQAAEIIAPFMAKLSKTTNNHCTDDRLQR